MTEAKRPEVVFVDVNGTSLYYEMMGEGHPLVLIHGGYMDRRMWDDQFAVGAEDHFQLHKSADKLEQDIAGAKRVTIPGTHQMPNMEKPEEFNQIVLDFLGMLNKRQEKRVTNLVTPDF